MLIFIKAVPHFLLPRNLKNRSFSVDCFMNLGQNDKEPIFKIMFLGYFGIALF